MGAICYGAGAGGALDLDAAAAENQEFLSTRSGERQEMIVLNDRLAAYIEKARPFPCLPHFMYLLLYIWRRLENIAVFWVRTLEQQNRLLETEIEALQNRFVKPSGLRMLYEEQLRELKRLADQMKRERDMALAAKEAMAGQLEMLKAKYEEAVELRKKAELDIEAFRPDVDAATAARIALEKQLENLEVEMAFLQRVQKQEMDSWYNTKFENLNNASTKHLDRVRSVREEITGAKKDIQNKDRELEALRTRNDALEVQIRERQEKYKKELDDLQAKIDSLQLELKSIKEKIALHLREYQELLNMKMALEIEITTYRKLIEGEDLRLTGMIQSMSIMSSSMSALSGSGVGLGGGMGVGMASGMGVGMASGMGVGMAVGMGSGVGAGLGGGIGAGLAAGSGGGIAGKDQMGGINSYSSEQAVETTERKTVLIRTVKGEDDTVQSDTQERTITISGAADDTDEE
ncbi:hypothetical protein SKAU_G00216280 [Synaphobranchus kaupii]|uniref:IF rod domain-containing protein n=1 Tax=Synaphobranchus kaupii TaxID=118154 RepID=A0A9Q1IVF8_SYNKA|nr:hypothetical protein SKAU_G00216280 [Synaphobranchus kaupii]